MNKGLKKKDSDTVMNLVEKLSKGTPIVAPPANETPDVGRVVKVITKKGTILVDEDTGLVICAQGIWREGRVDVGVVGGEEMISLDTVMMDMRLTNPMAANMVRKYFLDRKKAE